MKAFILFYFPLFFPVSINSDQEDPCSEQVYKEIPDLPRRAPSYSMDSAPLCDYHLSYGWYRGKYSKMPTSPPTLTFCGTLYPLWLNGTYPPVNSISTLDACKVGFASECSDKIEIEVKNCNTYMVYKLQPVDSCNSAYCFEPSGQCVTEVPQDPTVSYHGVSWETTRKGIQTRYEPSVNLKCGFTPLNNNLLFYEISWYVDNIEVLKGQTVASDSLDTALLSAYHILSHNKKAGSMIQCVVGAKHKKDGVACVTKPSPLFFAGIKVLTPRMDIVRGGTANVQLQFTIPYVDQNLRIGNFDVPVSDLVINLATLNASSISCNDGNNKLCGIKVKGYSFKDRHSYSTDIWKQIHNVTIFNKDDLDFTGFESHILLRLETVGTQGNGSRIFDHIALPDIQVFISEPTQVWKGKYCGSFTDPHMVSFDGYKYECQENGMYILYRNRKYDQEVQVKHHMCHPSHSYPRCTCAVAARSGRDVFTLDICNTQRIINFPFCKDKILKVIRNNDKNYQVVFPTGTWVDLSIIPWPNPTTWQINIKIYPSPSDVKNSRGLCGILDGNQNNDLTRRNGNVDSPSSYNYQRHPVDFSHSWRILDNENLFTESQTVYNGLSSISNTMARVCTCKVTKELNGNGQLVIKKTEIECNYGTYKDCKFKIGKQFHCLLHPAGSKRRKRDITHLRSLMEQESEYTVDENILERKKRQAYDVTTEMEARKICIHAFEESQAFLTCQQYVSDLSNATIDNCISDVMMTGDHNVTKIHIEAALEQCSTLVLFNTTFQTEQPEITYQVESLCPNNCSGNGECNRGNCTCNSNFAGSDCSFDLLGPPKINHISDFGLCDKSYEDCDEITLYGELFLEYMDTECYFTRRTIKRDGTVISESKYQTSLEPRTLFEGFCPLSYSTEPHWVTEFTFNISNDGTRFTDSYNVYTYQSDCQELHNSTGQINFILKSGYCFIDGKCYVDGDTNNENLCDLCNITLNKYKWSFNPGHCLIDGKCYADGAINGTNLCSVCLSSVNTLNWSDNPGYCYIEDICYFDGQSKEYNDCYMCNYTLGREVWTFAEDHCMIDGQCFQAGQNQTTKECKVCDPLQSKSNWTLRKGYCFFNDSCLKNGEFQKSNPCLMCNVSKSPYSLIPNPAYCNIGDLCLADGKENESNFCLICNTSLSRENWSLHQEYCMIDGQCFREGQNHTTKECKFCDPLQSKNNWSLSKGYCFVNGSCLKDGESEKLNPCLMCNATKSNDSLVPNPDFCNIGGLCLPDGKGSDSRSCLLCNTSVSTQNWSLYQGYCLIDGQCIQKGQKYGCKICDPLQNKGNWTLIAAYCNIGGLCIPDGKENDFSSCLFCDTSQNNENWSLRQGFCLIDKQCVRAGQNLTTNGCKVCDPVQSKNNWTLSAGYCFLNNSCIQDGKEDTTNPCLMCNTSSSLYSFSSNPANCNIKGECMLDGQKNNANSCLYCNSSLHRENWSLSEGYCLIDGQCFQAGQNHTTKRCNICDPIQSKSNWILNAGYCMIDGQCFQSGQSHSTSGCKMCNPLQNKSNWTLSAGYCFVNGTCMKDGQIDKENPCLKCNVFNSTYSLSSNHASCSIGGLCFVNGDINDAISCLQCNSSLSREKWSLSSGYCMIDGQCFQANQSKDIEVCRKCAPLQDIFNWTLSTGYCFVNGTCIKDGQIDKENPCLKCNVFNSTYSLSSNPASCNIGGLCFVDGKINDAISCLHCNSSLSTEKWSLSSGYCLIHGQCFQANQSKDIEVCKICDPHHDKYNWTLSAGHCFVNRTCIQDGQIDKENPCLKCNVLNSTYSLSSNPGHCLIEGQCFQVGQSNTKQKCKICDPPQNRLQWTLNTGYCLINDSCMQDGENNNQYSCMMCNTSASVKNLSLNKDCLTTVEVTTRSESTMSSQTSVHSSKEQTEISKKPTTTVSLTPDTTFSTKETTFTTVPVSKSDSEGTQNKIHTTEAVSTLTTVTLSTTSKAEPELTSMKGTTAELQITKETNKPFTIVQTSESMPQSPSPSCFEDHISSDFGISLKDNFCFINDTCVPMSRTNSYNVCEICIPQIQKFSWSSNTDCSSSTTAKMITESGSLGPVFIAIVSSAVAVCLTIIIVSVICCRKMRRRKYWTLQNEPVHLQHYDMELSVKKCQENE